jgi:hypothetical protein
MSFQEKMQNFIEKSKTEGLNFPMIQDPKTKEPSVTVTMVVVSFGFMGFCTVITCLLALNKLMNLFVPSEAALNILKEAFSMSLQMCSLSLGAYLGRKWQGGKEPTLGSVESAENTEVTKKTTNKRSERAARR